jgi:hypothetical protein
LQVLQYGSIHSAVATLSSLQSAADLSAAIAAAPNHAALQSLAAEAAATPQQSWLAQEYKVRPNTQTLANHNLSSESHQWL